MNDAVEKQTILKKTQLIGFIELIGQSLELSETQYKQMESRYQAIGTWLSLSDNPELRDALIYPQGSVSIGTTVKPIGGNEFDVDLVSHLPKFDSIETTQEYVKRLVGDRLKSHDGYAKRLEEKQRCWRINYANDMHLDITPSIINPNCHNGGELVPDKKLKIWKATNPRGFRDLINARAEMQPVLLILEKKYEQIRAEIESFPLPTRFKGLMKRIIQILKRHRDVWFEKNEPALAPISVIITTLASKSYENCVRNQVYETELDVFLDVVTTMPDFIEKQEMQGKLHYFIWNDTTYGENFAEKWNVDLRLAQAFYRWHKRLKYDLNHWKKVIGLDQVKNVLGGSLGESVVSKVFSNYENSIGEARQQRSLHVAPGVGLGLGSALSQPVRSNTFYGE